MNQSCWPREVSESDRLCAQRVTMSYILHAFDKSLLVFVLQCPFYHVLDCSEDVTSVKKHGRFPLS